MASEMVDGGWNNVMKKTSQRSLLFRQSVNRTEEEWVHFFDRYRQVLIKSAGIDPAMPL